MSLFPSIVVPLPFSLRMESTSYVFLIRMVFFYSVTTGWIFYIILCENSINQSINESPYVYQTVSGVRVQFLRSRVVPAFMFIIRLVAVLPGCSSFAGTP